MVDTTPDFRTQMLREKLGYLDAVLITHAHAGSHHGTRRLPPGLRPARRLPCPFMPPRTRSTPLRRVFTYAFDGRPIPRGYFHPDPRTVTGPFEIGDLRITPLELPMDAS